MLGSQSRFGVKKTLLFLQINETQRHIAHHGFGHHDALSFTRKTFARLSSPS